MILVDSHCHLIYAEFKNFLETRLKDKSLDYYSVENIVSRAKLAGVQYLVNIGTQLSDIPHLTAISERFPNVFRSIGIHPEYAKEHLETYSISEITEKFQNCCKLKKTIAIGEIGLDYFRDNNKTDQKKIFSLQLELAEEYNLPVSIHTRQAWQDTMDILENHPNVTGVIHCFSGEPEFTERVLKTPFYFGIGGTSTFKNNKDLHNSIKELIPIDRILLETDAPFLAPAPFRGTINESMFIANIAEHIATLKELSLNQVAECTTNNFYKLYPKAQLTL